MNGDDQVSSTNPAFESIDKFQSYSICKVCGDKNAQIHYAALSCTSCKMFFRRNSQFDLNNNQCVFDGKCDITINSRRACRYCRLKKCLLVGMQRNLLRPTHKKQRLHNKKLINEKAICLPSVIHPLDLLQNDRSLLTNEQWSYLSNVINLYDTKSPILHVRNLLKQELIYPIKIHYKMSVNNMFIIMSSMYEAILPFIEQFPHFTNLSLNDRSALIERNIKNAGGYSGIVLSRDSEFCSSSTFKIGFSSVYGSTIMNNALKINNRADNDSTLIKLLIPALIFSTGSDFCISINENEIQSNNSIDKYRLLSNAIYIFNIQNFYIEILFKYMIFRYGYEQASLRFAGLIKSSLDQSMCALHAEEIQKHEQLIKTVIQQTEQSLTLQNET